MIDREIKLPPKENYPPEPWRFVQKKIDPEQIGRDEAIFTTSNGYIGLRGSFEEGEPVVQKATFISGFHETWAIEYGEEAYGFAKTGQTMLPVTDACSIKLFVDDESFSLRHAYVSDYERALDFKNGTLDRSLIWDTASGKMIKIESQRLVSFPERHLAAMKYTVTMLNDDAHLTICSDIECHQVNHDGGEGDPRLGQKIHHKVFVPEVSEINEERIILGHSTFSSKLQMVCGMDHKLESEVPYTVSSKINGFSGRLTYNVEGKKNKSITIYKFISYHTSSPFPTMEDLADRTHRTLDRALLGGYPKLLKDQRKYLDDFWNKSDIKVTYPDSSLLQQNLRLHVFHLLQTSARVQNSGIGAKGLTGSGYEGHSFWDVEIYMLPFLIYNLPRVAKNLLIYRYNMLDKAREWAEMLAHRGALFPWRTINGEEASAFFTAGTAQYHINADIAYGIKKYAEVTGDDEFMWEYGVEMIIETARLWEDLGFYGADKKFHIHGVTGPDEYNAIVNDNTFTNLMARENLNYAAELARRMKKEAKDKYSALSQNIKLVSSEINAWEKAGKNMYVPYDKKYGINPQDDAFLQKEVWDFKNTPKDKYPLLLHYHPLALYRFQVIKQADVVLAMFLLGNEFSQALKKRNFEYYDPLTTGDSSLSVSIQGIMAAELDSDLSMKYFRYASLMDLGNIGGNVSHGLHLASMGGIWMFIVYGAAGMRDYGGEISFDPRIKNAKGYLRRLQFKLTIRGCLLSVDMTREKSIYKLLTGESFTFYHKRKKVTLTKGKSITC